MPISQGTGTGISHIQSHIAHSPKPTLVKRSDLQRLSVGGRGVVVVGGLYPKEKKGNTYT